MFTAALFIISTKQKHPNVCQLMNGLTNCDIIMQSTERNSAIERNEVLTHATQHV